MSTPKYTVLVTMSITNARFRIDNSKTKNVVRLTNTESLEYITPESIQREQKRIEKKFINKHVDYARAQIAIVGSQLVIYVRLEGNDKAQLANTVKNTVHQSKQFFKGTQLADLGSSRPNNHELVSWLGHNPVNVDLRIINTPTR